MTAITARLPFVPMKSADVEELFLNNLALIDRAIGYVCGRNRLGADEGEEFGSYVKFKLIESNYAILRKFEGRSSLSTYMTTVIQRMFFQYRTRMWGKWRPSAQAKRLGDSAITLERMLTRDGYTYGEAVSVLTTGSQAAYTRAELDAIYLRLPVRHPRPVLVPASEVSEAAPHYDPHQALLAYARNDCARATAEAIDDALGAMDAEDQIILRMRFWGGRTIPQISAALGLEARRVYKRIDKLLLQLRSALQEAGVDRTGAGDLLAHNDHALTFSFPVAEGRTEFRHSQEVMELGRSAKRRLRK